MKRFLAAVLALLVTGAPALAKDFVQDQAGMFSPATVNQLNARIGNFNAQTGKEIVVQTVPSVSGGDVRTAAENSFAQQQVNGVLIFVDQGDRKSYVIPDRAAVQAGWWSTQTSSSIIQAMTAQFRAGDYDGGIGTAVNMALNVYRSHVGSLRSTQPVSRTAYAQQQAQGGVHISMFWWIIIALFAFFIIRSIMRAASGPRYYGGGPGAPGYGPGGPGYGPGPGYGGYGWGGGGGGFWSGLLGGLGGAFLGNELFGHQNWGGGNYANVDPNAGNVAPSDGGGWQSDPGQADVSGGAGGDWGGGGFGGGDFGGGGGFGGGDFGGGGGGDAGGGW